MANNKNTTNNSDKKQHSFYKEVNSSWREYDGKFSWKKSSKLGIKILKWSGGLFLAVSALWGCVQGFIITTSTQVAKGLETYMTYNDVIPNFFQVEENYSYQVQTNVLIEDPLNPNAPTNYDNWINTKGLAPLPFLIENPEYGKVAFVNKDDTNYDSKNPQHVLIRDLNYDGIIDEKDVLIWEENVQNYLYLKPAQFQFTAVRYSLPTVAYQATVLDPIFLNNYLTIKFDTSGTNQGNGFFMRPSNSLYSISYDFKDNNGPVPAWRKLNDEKNGFDYVKKTLGEQNGFVIQNPDKDDGILMYKRNTFSTPSIITGNSLNSDWYYNQPAAFIGTGVQWTVNETINLTPSSANDKYSLAANQIIYSINTQQFLTENLSQGTTASDLELIDPNDETQIVSGVDLIDQLELDLSNDDSLDDEQKIIAEDNLEQARNYLSILNAIAFNTNDFTLENMGVFPNPPIVPLTLDVSFGASLMIVPSTGVPTLIPTNDALETFENSSILRQNDYFELRGYGGDSKIANAGWMLLGDKPDQAESFENRRNIYYAYDNNGNLINNPFAAQQKTAFKGEYDDSNLIVANEKILENKLTNLISTGQIDARMKNFQYTINGSIYKVPDFYSTINGFSALTEQGGYSSQAAYIPPINQRGVTNYNTIYEDNLIDNGTTPWETGNYTTIQTSSLDYSIISAQGGDPDNSSRYAMVSWGEAWSWGGPYYGAFVWPLSKLSMSVQSVMDYSVLGGWSVIFGVLLIILMLRGIGTLLSWRKNNQQQKMQELQLQVANIKAKYTDHKENKQVKQRMQMEIQALYRKNNVNPLSSMSTMLVTLPVFLALWTIISAIPIYKTASLGGFILALNPLNGMFNTGLVGLIYLIFAALIIFVQIVSTKLPNWLSAKRKNIKNLDDATKAQMKKQNRTMTIMLVVFIILGFTIPTLLGLYWIFSGLFTIANTLVQHWNIERKSNKSRAKVSK